MNEITVAFLEGIRDFPNVLDNPDEEYTRRDLVEIFRSWAVEADMLLNSDAQAKR